MLLKVLNVEELLEHEAFTVWKQFTVGSSVLLQKGTGASEGKILVRLAKGMHVIGVLPKDDCKIIKKFADAGWPIDKMFTCHICRIDEAIGQYDQKIHILIHIKDLTDKQPDAIPTALLEK